MIVRLVKQICLLLWYWITSILSHLEEQLQSIAYIQFNTITHTRMSIRDIDWLRQFHHKENCKNELYNAQNTLIQQKRCTRLLFQQPPPRHPPQHVHIHIQVQTQTSWYSRLFITRTSRGSKSIRIIKRFD